MHIYVGFLEDSAGDKGKGKLAVMGFCLGGGKAEFDILRTM